MTGPARPPLTVLLSLSPPDGTTRFVDQVTEGLPDEVRLRYFTWSTALLGRYDLFHLHWPEHLLRRARGRLPLEPLLLALLLLRCRLLGRPVVRTLHNVEPHDEAAGALDRRLLQACDRATTLFTRLNPTTAVPAGGQAVTVLHGHYRDRFAALPHPAPEPGRVLYFGLIKPYKGVDELLRLFAAHAGADHRLRVVGRPADAAWRGLVERAAAADPRITALLAFVDDATLVEEVGRSRLVVLPYREMHNSGAVLVALSLDRPVVAPRSAANTALEQEVGPGWLHLYDGDLSYGTVRSALAAPLPAEPPRLSGRDWPVVGEQLHAAYLLARDLRAGRRRAA